MVADYEHIMKSDFNEGYTYDELIAIAKYIRKEYKIASSLNIEMNSRIKFLEKKIIEAQKEYTEKEATYMRINSRLVEKINKPLSFRERIIGKMKR